MDFLLILLYIIIVVSLLFVYIYTSFQRTYTFWSKYGVPTPKPEFPYGNGRLLFQGKLNFGEFGASVYNEVRKSTSSFGGFYIFGRIGYLPIDPELVKDVLTRSFHIFTDRGLYCDEETDPLSANLLNLRGQKWKKIRGKVSPTFTTGKIKNMFQTLLACSGELDKVLEAPARKDEPIDIRDVILRLTTDNIGSCAFGIECNSLKHPNAEFRKYGKLVMDTTFSDAKWNIFAINFPFIMKTLRIPITHRKVSEFFMNTLREVVDYREKNKVHRKDFLDLFIKLKNNEFEDESGKIKKNEEPLTFNELAAQAYVFFVGGFETSGTTLTFCLFELTQNPEVQIKLRTEIRRVLEKYDGNITYEAIQDMNYMDKVISETLRKYPSLPMINRQCNEPYTIPGTNVTLPKGYGCWIAVLSIHRDPQNYPNPMMFDPERFTEEEKAKRHPFTYLPFGEGPRICIGMRFAFLQMKVALTKLLRRYSFTLDEKTVLPMEFAPQGITLAPKNKIWLLAQDLDV